MKLHKPEVAIESAGAKSSSRFSIEASQQAFAVLSSTIYEDKIKAPIRELSTNAYDAHVEAGCPDKPFEVHLPNAIDPEFRVRDYGVSMSHEDVMSLYTTYFGSNKRNSNSLNGCLGLGSKSPFAYTNQFWVTAYKDGKKRNYVATVDTDGSRLDEYPECDTDEADGFEVGFVVKEDDFATFKSRASEVYKYFSTQPIVTGTDFEHEQPSEPKLSGDDWGFVGSNSQSIAIMGNIGYPIDEEKFWNDNLSWSEARKEPVYQMLNAGVILHFDIGELSMTASREGLEYTDFVKEAIKNKVIKLRTDLQKRVDGEFKHCKSMYEARLTLVDYGEVIRTIEDFVVPQWNGEEVKSSAHVPHEISVQRISYDGRPKLTRNIERLHFNRDTVFVFQDEKNGSNIACKHYVDQNPNKTVYLCSHEQYGSEVLDKIGMKKEHFILVSSLPKPPKNTVIRNGKRVRSTQTSMFEYDITGSQYSTSSSWESRWWKPVKIDVASGDMNIFVELCRFEVEGKHTKFSMKRIFEAMEVLGLQVPTVYGQPKAKCKRLHKADNWITFESWVEEVLIPKVDKSFSVDSVSTSVAILQQLELKGLETLEDVVDISFVEGSYISKYTNAVRKLREVGDTNDNADFAAVNTIVTGGGHRAQAYIELDEATAKKWEKREQRILKRYPAINLFRNRLEAHHLRSDHYELERKSLVESINHSEVAYRSQNK
jgi:hypothetical protein